MRNSQRFTIEHTKVIENELGVVYVNENKLTAQGFTPKAIKSTFHYRFTNIEKLNSYVDSFFKNLQSRKDSINARKEERKAFKHDLNVGDIIVDTWGYDQTNVDFYQITKVSGKKITYKKIASKADVSLNTGNSMAEYVLPVKDAFISTNEISKIISSKYCVRKFDGKPEYSSWYA